MDGHHGDAHAPVALQGVVVRAVQSRAVEVLAVGDQGAHADQSALLADYCEYYDTIQYLLNTIHTNTICSNKHRNYSYKKVPIIKKKNIR